MSLLDLNSRGVRKEIGDNVRRLRLEKELSQQRLARRSGVDQSVVSRVESGGRWLEFALLVKLADGLEEPVAALIPGWVERLLGISIQPRGRAGRPGAPT